MSVSPEIKLDREELVWNHWAPQHIDWEAMTPDYDDKLFIARQVVPTPGLAPIIQAASELESKTLDSRHVEPDDLHVSMFKSFRSSLIQDMRLRDGALDNKMKRTFGSMLLEYQQSSAMPLEVTTTGLEVLGNGNEPRIAIKLMGKELGHERTRLARPMHEAIKALGGYNQSETINSALRNGFNPHVTLVKVNKGAEEWARDWLVEYARKNLAPLMPRFVTLGQVMVKPNPDNFYR